MVILKRIKHWPPGGYAGLKRVMKWNLDFMSKSDEGKAYLDVAKRVDEAIQVHRLIHITQADTHELATCQGRRQRQALHASRDLSAWVPACGACPPAAALGDCAAGLHSPTHACNRLWCFLVALMGSPVPVQVLS